MQSDDEDDEEESPEASAVAAKSTEGEVKEPADGEVKQELDGEGQPKKRRTPAYELHMYSAEELASFKKREMIADAELLDGKILFRCCAILNHLPLAPLRKTQECQTKSKRPQRI